MYIFSLTPHDDISDYHLIIAHVFRNPKKDLTTNICQVYLTLNILELSA